MAKSWCGNIVMPCESLSGVSSNPQRERERQRQRQRQRQTERERARERESAREREGAWDSDSVVWVWKAWGLRSQVLG